MKVSAIVWALPGPMNPSLKQGAGDDYWGNLHGSFDLVRARYPTTKRKVVIEWDNEGVTAAARFTKGKDLTLTRNRILY